MTTRKAAHFVQSNGVERGGTYTCVVCGKRTRETGDGESQYEMCRKCWFEAGLENEHLDGVHDDGKMHYDGPKNEFKCQLCVKEGRS